MARAIADDYKVKFIEVLTGFKFIGEQIKLFEQNGSNNYVFGLEESYGCLAGTHARDKDAIVAVMCLCEMAAWCKKNGKTVWDQMITLYEKYGYFKESQYSITMKGIDGAKEIEELMNKLRSNPPKAFGELKVKEFRDYTTGKTLNLETGEAGETGLPQSNVLYFDLTVFQSFFQRLCVEGYPPQWEQGADRRLTVMNGAEAILQKGANCILSTGNHVNDRDFGCTADVRFGILVDDFFHRHLEFMCNIENVSRVEQNRSDTCSTCRISGI